MYLYWISYCVVVLLGYLLDINKTYLMVLYGLGAGIGLFFMAMSAVCNS